MNSLYYSSTTIWTMVVNVAFLLATLNLLKKGNATGTTKSIFGLFSIIWIAFLYYVIDTEIIIPKEISGLSFYIFTLVAAALVLTFFYFSSLRKIFENIKQEDIQWVQGIRVFVASGFLWKVS